jgi:hypothetical protein
MTTRQYLRQRWTRTVFAAIALFFAAGLLEYFLSGEGTSDYFLRATVLVAFACLLWNQARTPCLKCRRPLGIGALWWVATRPRAHYSPRCPHCNVSIDRDIPDSLVR